MSVEKINPPELYKHPAYTRIMKVKNPKELIFLAGLTPADENYQPVTPGDMRGQYIKILEDLTLQLKAAGATWDDVVFRRMYTLDVDAFMEVLMDPEIPHPWDTQRPSPSTMIGVTRLSNPKFLIEVEILAVTSD